MKKGPVYIYYSSFSGTAEGFANALNSELESHSIKAITKNIKDCTEKNLKNENHFIFIVSTHYKGNCCDDANKFNEWLDEEENKSFLKGKKYTIFGLGDNNYTTFNFFSKRLYNKFEEFEMEEFFGYGTGSDHDDNIEMDFVQWKEDGLVGCLEKILPNFEETKINLYLEEIIEDKNGLFFLVGDLDDESLEKEKKREFKFELNFKKYENCKKARVLDIKEERIIFDDLQSVMKIDLELESENEYTIAQNILIFPENDNVTVNNGLEYFGLENKKNFFVIINNDNPKKKMPFRSGLTVIEILTKFVDLKEFPKNSFLKKLSKIIDKNDSEKILTCMKNKKSLEDFKKERFGVLDFLKYYKIEISFEKFLEISNRIKARYFTIASCPIKKNLTILLKKETFKKKDKIWTGLASSFFTLEKLYFDEKRKNKKSWISLASSLFKSEKKIEKFINYKIQISTFKIPEKKSNVLMIGTGTGVAPFISIIEDKKKNEKSIFKNLNLIFGIRDKKEDFICKEFLENCLKEKVLDNLNLVCSRENEKKFYVQNFLEKNKNLVNDIFSEETDNIIYICGNLDMCKEIIKIIKVCISEFKEISDVKEIDKIFKDLQKKGKICYEAWG